MRTLFGTEVQCPAIAAADIDDGVFRRHSEPGREFARLLVIPAAQHHVVQTERVRIGPGTKLLQRGLCRLIMQGQMLQPRDQRFYFRRHGRSFPSNYDAARGGRPADSRICAPAARRSAG